jgi:hypothetical protein
LRAIHFKRRLERRRRVIFLYYVDKQPGLTVLLGEPIAGRIVASHSREPRQHIVEFLRVERFAREGFQVTSNVDSLVLAGAFDFDELGRWSVRPLS